MRVVVVGASGNSGTALLRALAAEPRITSVLGVARRVPDLSVEPYGSAEWATFDVAREVPAADEDAYVTELAALFAGADAVVHLAWLIQPNRDRDLLRRANVGGTARVARAAAQVNVPQLVAASSVGVYAAVDDDVLRDESWDRRGMPTSHYSVDKVAQEKILDDLERANPAMAVARLRPSLIFQEEAGSGIRRYFLGGLVPRGLLRPGRLPVVPLPTGIRLQVVHADDVAQAYLQVILHQARGAFNIAADPVLGAGDLAQLVGRGRLVQVPPGLVRRVVWAAYASRLIPTDPGWVDLGMGAPLMDTSRARRELGWLPTRSAEVTLTEILDGIAGGEGTGSVPLRPDGEPERPPV